jgi:hypothetical protein
MRFTRNAGNIHIYGRRRRNVNISSAGGLQALEFVQCLVEAALYGGLVAGELGKSVRFIRVPDEGPSKCGSFTVPHRLHLLSLGEGLLVFPLVEYHGR